MGHVIARSPWTAERVEKLRGLWADGITAMQIAKQLTEGSANPFTKNMVIGKVYRLDLEYRAPALKGKSRRGVKMAKKPTQQKTPISRAAEPAQQEQHPHQSSKPYRSVFMCPDGKARMRWRPITPDAPATTVDPSPRGRHTRPIRSIDEALEDF
ncbi:MAG: GcrA family cell cycle regulator [Minisyncoccia bacterium]